MNDKELLEYAAKAAGLDVQRSRLDDPLNRDFLINGEGVRNPQQKSYPWNPLTDDGDALRLATKCLIDIHQDPTQVSCDSRNHCHVWENHAKQGSDSATRRAIVRAAAEIGKAMP